MRTYIVILIFFSSILFSCATQTVKLDNPGQIDDLYVVDCLLPAQVRKLGQIATYLAARRAIKTSALDCGIRGGEYVAYDRANYLSALNIWMPKAQTGDPEAQTYVGEIYEKGMGLQPDYQVAHLWYKKAAEQGFSKAQMNLGYLYEKGLGVKKNQKTAILWYQKASNFSELKIPFASTVTSESESKDLSSEIKLLQTALTNSQAETKNLKNKIVTLQNNLSDSKVTLKLLKKEVVLVQDKIQKNVNKSNDQNLKLLQQLLKKKNQEINSLQTVVKIQEKTYKKEKLSLAEKLTNTQKRAEQIVVQLKKENNQNQQKQVALLEKEAKLAETEKRLLKAIDLSNMQKNELKIVKENVNIKEKSLQLAEQQLVQTQQKIINYEQEIINDKQSEKRISKWKKKLFEQDKQSQLDLDQTQNKLNQSEQRYLSLVSLSKQQLNQIEQQKTLLIATKTSGSKSEERYLQNLNAKSVEVETLKKKLTLEKQRYESEINKLQKNIKADQPYQKPKIEIIDPPFVLTRGIHTVTLRSVVKKREIIGKIEAPAGLMALYINDKKSTVNQQKMFKTEINLVGDNTPVKIVAIDENGNKASLNFILSLNDAIKSLKVVEPVTVSKKEPSWKDLDFGNYHALIIGNNDYRKVPKLDTPENDARVVEKILRSKYGFKTQLLLNGTRYQILSALNKLRAKLTENDNLLIYYAGHGELDQVNMRGHWLPVDADGDNSANWISTIAITDILNAMSVKHVMIVSDSCYSGAMTRSSLARLDAGATNNQRNQWLKAMLKTRSRTVLTSGGLKPVMDGGGGNHSVFANAFIEALKKNNNLLEGQALYRKVSAGIVSIASEYGIEQVPEYAPIRHAGHESGEFFFVPKNQS